MIRVFGMNVEGKDFTAKEWSHYYSKERTKKRKFDSLPPSSTQMQFHFIPYFSWFSCFLFCQIFEIFL